MHTLGNILSEFYIPRLLLFAYVGWWEVGDCSGPGPHGLVSLSMLLGKRLTEGRYMLHCRQASCSSTMCLPMNSCITHNKAANVGWTTTTHCSSKAHVQCMSPCIYRHFPAFKHFAFTRRQVAKKLQMHQPHKVWIGPVSWKHAKTKQKTHNKNPEEEFMHI